jgi:hypothetical protein
MKKTKHEITWTPTGTIRWRNETVTGLCTCGQEWDHPWLTLTKSGNLSKQTKRAEWIHIAAQEVESDQPMTLVGRIVKTRVTNEVWIAHQLGELPDSLKSWRAKDYQSDLSDAGKAYPWLVLLKNSQGWKLLRTHFSYYEGAYSYALDYLEGQYIEGHLVEVATSIDMDTIEVPIGRVETYLTKLVTDANELDKPEDLVELAGRIKSARSMLEMLEAAQTKVEMKLIGIEPEETTKYTTYVHTPQA